MQILLYLKAHWDTILGILIVLGLAVWVYIDWQYARRQQSGPRDTVGNGITVGLAKAFDNRSLSLRIERLSNSLAQMKVIDQKATENIGKLQGQDSTVSSQTLTLNVAAGKPPAASGTSQTSASASTSDSAGKTGAASADANKPESKTEVSLAAGDILNEQLNLASQIMNLQTLYERSLTDRLIGQDARLQTVLGLQVSITPPAGFENCVAVVEVAVRMKPPQVDGVSTDRVSLVAMIPQEKTYNSQSISTESQSIGGSAVASVVTLGVTSKGESRDLFVHRDSDTVAFERNSTGEPRLFPGDDNATVFGWEFRPVLGQKTVSAGMRQMLAVVALPASDQSEHPEDLLLQIKTRSYWRRYDRETQTSSGKWHWYPHKTDGSGTVETEEQDLAVPNTAKIQAGLAPKVAAITWVNSGVDRATVIVKGENFFPGTKVLAGGKAHREDDGTLTLKSDQALEFETTLTAIASGDAVLSGRFGRSSQLEAARIPNVQSLYITRAAIKQSRRGKDLRISIDVKGIDETGEDIDLNVGDFEGLPEPILFVGNEPIPMPYDYWPVDAHVSTSGDQPTGAVARSAEFSFAKASTKKSVRVEAWIPSRIAITRNSSVMFRVPFCGLQYQASWPIQFFEPTVTRLGGDAINSVFRISHSLWHERTMTVELDQVYATIPALEKVSKDDGEYRFTIANVVLEQYRNMVLRIEGAEPYLVPIPEDKPKPKAALELNTKPPAIKKGTIGPAEWSGTNLGLIKTATLITGPVATRTRTETYFTPYESGKKIAVYFDKSAIQVTGIAEIEFQTEPVADKPLKAQIVITDE